MKLKLFLISISALLALVGYKTYSEAKTAIPGWKKFTDKQVGYSIQYPEKWTIEKTCVGGYANDTYSCIKSPELGLSPIPDVIKGQLITIGPKGSSYFPSSGVPSDFCNEDPMSKIKSCTDLIVGGRRAIKKTFENYPFIDVAILKQEQIEFVIRLQYPSNLLMSSQSFETFDQILSTFHFLD